jgi:Xaa-Pro aminopeptidase
MKTQNEGKKMLHLQKKQVMDKYQELLADDLRVRRRKIRDAILQNGADACLLATGINIFYAAGCVYNGYYYLPAEGDPLHFVKRPAGLNLEQVIYIRKPEQLAE